MKTNGVIPVELGNLGLEVNSALLHKVLGVKESYDRWIERIIDEMGYVKGDDFDAFPILEKSKSAKHKDGRKRYLLKIDVAKELAILENTLTGDMVELCLTETEMQYNDWVGAVLPELKVHRDPLGERTGFNYDVLSWNCEYITRSLYRWIEQHPQEFWENADGDKIVSERFGRVIALKSITRQIKRETERVLKALDKQVVKNQTLSTPIDSGRLRSTPIDSYRLRSKKSNKIE
jgi:phage anti-repressor protein